MFEKFYNINELRKILNIDKTIDIPTIGEREKWEMIDEYLKQFFICKADEFVNRDWKVLQATEYMDYARVGGRNNYVFTDRRMALGYMSIAECIENKGRFIDEIINGIWMMCEMSSWVCSAHNSMDARGQAHRDKLLPDVENSTIDLDAAEIAAMLSIIYHLLKKPLDNVTPTICRRIEYEVQKRVIERFLEKDFFWMGFDSTLKLNNWTPWITSNCLTACIILNKDIETKSKFIKRVLQAIENFLSQYHGDGGCDEGPAYWCVAGGTLFECLELLWQVSDKAIDVFSEKLIANIGSYIYKMYIGNGYYANFADGEAGLSVSYDLLYRYGMRTGDKNLVGLAISEFKRSNGLPKINSWFPMLKILNTAFSHNKIKKIKDNTLPLIRDSFMADIEIMTVREKEGSTDGLYMAVKGGHNGESHNHNDVGSFMVYIDGTPIIIDVGVGVYTYKTFSPERYSIWTMQSQYHNLATINGYMQKDGKEYSAMDVKCSFDENESEIVMDISKAYPCDAEINSFQHSLKLVREAKSHIIIEDNIYLNTPSNDIKYNFMSSCECKVNNGMIIFGDNLLTLNYNAEVFDACIEKIVLDDEKLISNWGKCVYRIVLSLKKSTKKVKATFILACIL